MDSDWVESPNHVEFANTVAGPDDLAVSAFNADTYGNGILDGEIA